MRKRITTVLCAIVACLASLILGVACNPVSSSSGSSSSSSSAFDPYAGMTENTIDCLINVNSFRDVEELATWLEWDINDPDKRQEVSTYSDFVARTRTKYLILRKDKKQLQLFGDENRRKLMAVEEQMRAIKTYFSTEFAPIFVSEVVVSPVSEHQREYVVGERFHCEDLTLDVIYNDGSLKEIYYEDGEITLLGDKPFQLGDSAVTVVYDDGEHQREEKIFVSVVTLGDVVNKYPEQANKVRMILIIGGLGLFIVGGLGLIATFRIKNKQNDFQE